jgi:hypothetical protein
MNTYSLFCTTNCRCFEFKLWILIWFHTFSLKPAEGNSYSKDLFWVSYDKPATFHANGRVRVGLGRESCGPHQGRVPAVNASVAFNSPWHCRRVWRWAATVEQIWLLAHSKPTSCAQVSKRLVAYIKILIVLSPYGRTSASRIAAIADAHFRQSWQTLASVWTLTLKAHWHMERKAGKFFTAYGFVAREGSQSD